MTTSDCKVLSSEGALAFGLKGFQDETKIVGCDHTAFANGCCYRREVLRAGYLLVSNGCRSR